MQRICALPLSFVLFGGANGFLCRSASQGRGHGCGGGGIRAAYADTQMCEMFYPPECLCVSYARNILLIVCIHFPPASEIYAQSAQQSAHARATSRTIICTVVYQTGCALIQRKYCPGNISFTTPGVINQKCHALAKRSRKVDSLRAFWRVASLIR